MRHEGGNLTTKQVRQPATTIIDLDQKACNNSARATITTNKNIKNETFCDQGNRFNKRDGVGGGRVAIKSAGGGREHTRRAAALAIDAINGCVRLVVEKIDDERGASYQHTHPPRHTEMEQRPKYRFLGPYARGQYDAMLASVRTALRNTTRSLTATINNNKTSALGPLLNSRRSKHPD